MKTELRLKEHSVLDEANVIEVIADGKILCAIYGADRPGIRIVSRHMPNDVVIAFPEGHVSTLPSTGGVGVLEVRFGHISQ